MTAGRLRKPRGWAAPGPSLFLLLTLLVLPLAAMAGEAADRELAADEAWSMAARGDVVIVDVRTPDEWRETGVAQGALRISLYSGRGVPNLGFVAEVTSVAGARPIALICAAGVRSSLAAVLLQGEGFAAVYDVAEGVLGSDAGPGWLARGLPVEPCGDCPPG